MFAPPNILLIQNFDFERHGVAPKTKFLIVLLQTNTDAIIAPLTTSQDYVPDHYKTKRCIKDDAGCIHCYYIPKQVVIGQNGFSFAKDTYVHINPLNLKKRSIANLRQKYELTAAAALKDALTDSEYSDFLYCLYKSQHVPRGVRKTMEPIIERIEKNRQPQN
ncbi:hypothetical protein [Chryseolinea lacunae]|uniref:Uncharacterized protein n=1 Tax=Chryseolinea lacunae TaxID=2801331 RepID=A0ABS1KNR0_9BACT|nr:hypothetical protein [Chryseolinea lacunae]MBL0739881.1 hypothetical protein [Chryseolinea lacunae]